MRPLLSTEQDHLFSRRQRDYYLDQADRGEKKDMGPALKLVSLLLTARQHDSSIKSSGILALSGGQTHV